MPKPHAAAAASPDNAALQQAAADAQAALTAAEAALEAADELWMTLLTTSGIELEGANVAITNHGARRRPVGSVQFLVHAVRPVLRSRPRPRGQGRQRHRVHPAAAGRSALRSDEPDQLHGADARHLDGRRRRHHGHGRRRRGPINTTTPFVDQNQTYTSHASHQVFLRQYVLNAARRSGCDRQADRGRQWRHGHLGRRQGAGADNARHPADRLRRRQRAAARDRPVRQFHPRPERASRRS